MTGAKRVALLLTRVVAMAVLATTAGIALAAPDGSEPHGPAFGQNRYATSIRNEDGVADADDYVSSLLEGELLSVNVAAARRSTLQPKLEILDPNGGHAPVAVRSTRGNRSAQISAFRIPKSGNWTVRVTGGNSTVGAYVVSFSVRPAPPVVFEGQVLGDGQPTFRIQPFPGIDGALLDFKLTWSAKGTPVSLRSVTDPSDAEVLGLDGQPVAEQAEENRKRHTVTLSGVPLHSGDGDYAFRVRASEGSARYDATVKVTPVGRPRGRKPLTLSADEPFLEPRTTPLVGRKDAVVRLDGKRFSTVVKPRVFIGGIECADVVVASGGTSLTATVPQGVPGSTVGVAVVNPDGQSSVRAGYFSYLQPIRIVDLVDDAGVAVRAGSTRGGRALHLVGENLGAGQTVRFGTVTAAIPTVVSSTEMLVVTPASPSGSVFVSIVDEFGGVAASTFQFRFKAPPTFDAQPYAPPVTPVGVSVFVLISGKDFEATDQLTFDGAPMASTFLDAHHRSFTVPALAVGSYSVTLTDSIGTVERGPDFAVKPPPTIAAAAVGGPRIGAKNIAVGGGTRVQVDGTSFHVSDVVTLGGTAVAGFVTHTPTSFTFDAPPGALGLATLTVTDGAGQGTSLPDALRYIGYADATPAHSPRASSVDSLLADRGAVGDLDGDGAADDLAIVTSYYSVGTRKEATRLFFGNAQGALTDVTAANFPASGSDSSGADLWNASAVAIGDVDGANGADIVISGVAPYAAYYGGVYNGTRLFRNTGGGHFVQDEINAPPSAYVPAVFAYDQTGAYYMVYSPVFDAGVPTTVAIGDLDRDGDNEIVVGRDTYELRYVGIDPTKVNFAVSPPYVATANVTYLSYFQYAPGTKIYDNDIAHARGFVDVTAASLPPVGDSNSPPIPCFQARDLALGDVDGDKYPDLVVTWDDPTTVSAYGTYVGPNIDIPRVSTRILINDKHAKFTDQTSSWMPAASVPEFWQGRRVALFDFDKDNDLDLVILHDQGLDAFNTRPSTHSRSALRILRNDGAGHGFVNVTATAIPALPGDGDDFRGAAMAIRDVDGDGWADIVISSPQAILDAAGGNMRATRLFRGGPNLTFTLESGFLPVAGNDSGEASDVFLIGDLAGSSDPSILLLSPVTPAQSAGGERLRVLDFHR